MRILIILGLLAAATFISQDKYTALSPVDFYEKLSADSSVVLLDVRLYEDYVVSRIKNAVWAGTKDVLLNVLKGIDKEQNIYLYCYEGGKRGKTIIGILQKFGYSNIFFLKGGFKNWKRQRLEIDRSKINN